MRPTAEPFNHRDVVGGGGIFSVLKISIGERLYEIGLRKSMGASDGEVFFQFLVESITLSRYDFRYDI